MPSELNLALLTTPLNFLPHSGHSYMPITVTVIRIFLSGNGATSSHVLYGSFTGVSHSGQLCFRFFFFGMWRPAFLGWNLLFLQYFPEGFLTCWTVKKSNRQLGLHSLTVCTSSHIPCFPRFRHFSSTIRTFSHLTSSHVHS